MSSERLSVTIPDGEVDARLFLPEAPGTFPLVVQYMDALGLRPAFDAMGQRLADAGYAVLQPNLYRRSPPYTPFDYGTAFSDPAERMRIFALMNGFTAEEAMADTRVLVDHVDSDPRIDAGSIGVVGYCMGGRMALFAAEAMADRVVAAAPIHGGGLVTKAPNSPHLRVDRIRGQLLFGIAAHDDSCPPEAVAALRQALVDAGTSFTIHEEGSARHGYAVPDAPVYDEAAAERHWVQILELFEATLGC